MYATKFSDSGYEVDTADSSAAVISLLEQGNIYDLSLLDIVMPGTSGLELLKLINENFPNQISHHIFLTNQGQERDIKEAKAVGAVGYIIKSETIPSEVVAEVGRIIDELKQ